MDFRGPWDGESTVLDSLAIRTEGLRRVNNSSRLTFTVFIKSQAGRPPALAGSR